MRRCLNLLGLSYRMQSKILLVLVVVLLAASITEAGRKRKNKGNKGRYLGHWGSAKANLIQVLLIKVYDFTEINKKFSLI